MMPGWFFSRSVASAASSPTDMLWLGCLCAARMVAMIRLRSLLWKAPWPLLHLRPGVRSSALALALERLYC